jgi:hypothetical protein
VHVIDKSTNHHISTCMHSQFASKKKKFVPYHAPTICIYEKNHSMHHKNISKHALTVCIQKKFVSHNMHPRFAFTRKFPSYDMHLHTSMHLQKLPHIMHPHAFQQNNNNNNNNTPSTAFHHLYIDMHSLRIIYAYS